MASSFIVTSAAADLTSTGKYGDVNFDGKVNSTDALVALQKSASNEAVPSEVMMWADVNGDQKLNATDALEILMVSVGKKAKFTVEVKIPTPSTKDEMLAVYIEAIAKARKDIPSYKLKVTANTKDPEVSGLLVSGMSEKELAELKQGLVTDNSYQNVYGKGSTSALQSLPLDLAVKDASKFKNITCTTLGDGNYQIVIELKDESNPKEGSVICKVMNMPDFDATQKAFEEEMASVGGDVPMTVSLKSLDYKNCKITFTVDSTTGELISLVMYSDMVVAMDMTVMLFPMSMKMTTVNISEYSNFTY